MSRTRKIILSAIAGLALIGAVVGTAYAFHLGFWGSEDLGPVIARVDGRPIYLSEAKARVEGLSSVHGDVEKAMGEDWHDKVLQSLVDDVIIQEEADRRGIVVSDQELSASVAQLRGKFQTQEAFEKWLDTLHLDVTELERRMKLQALGSRVYEAVTADVQVTSEEMHAYYRSHRADYQTADGTTAPFKDVRATVKQAVEKREKDKAFEAWLDDRRQSVDVVVVSPDWWRNIL